jgi:hypothetical protein
VKAKTMLCNQFLFNIFATITWCVISIILKPVSADTCPGGEDYWRGCAEQLEEDKVQTNPLPFYKAIGITYLYFF